MPSDKPKAVEKKTMGELRAAAVHAMTYCPAADPGVCHLWSVMKYGAQVGGRAHADLLCLRCGDSAKLRFTF